MLLLSPAEWAEAQALSRREPDSLLYREDLQEIVALQNARDGGGLAARLGSADPAVRARAAFALASVQDTLAVQPLLAALADGSSRVRVDAAFALGQLGPAVPARPLLEALAREQDSAVRRELFMALGKSGDQRSLAELVRLPLRRGDAEWAALAVGRYALRNVHAPEATAWLVSRLRSPDPAVRLYAAYYFGRSARTAPWAALEDSVRLALDRLRPEDPAATQLLAALGRLDDAGGEGRPAAHWSRTSPDWRTRVNAVNALARRSGAPEARAALLAALSDSAHHVRRAAASTLLNAPDWSDADRQAARAWLETTPGGDAVRALVMQGLARHGADTSFVWEQIRAARKTGGRTYARYLDAASELPGGEALAWLVREAEHRDARIAYAALEGLAARWRRERAQGADPAPYFGAFAGGLRRRDLATAYAAAPLLADSLFRPLGGVGVLTEVYATLRSPNDVEPMTAILSALGEAGTPEARETLERALQDPLPVVRQTAAAALGMPIVPPGPGTPEPPQIDWSYLQRLGTHPVLLLETERGTIRLTLDTEQAPLTAQTILKLAEAGRYDGVPFHRVVPNFVVQGGDFERGDGFGGPGFSILSEFTRIPYVRGALGMASAGKDTEGSQFFVTHSIQPHLDGRYTAFGYVTEGMDVVDRLEEDDLIVRARVEPAPSANRSMPGAEQN